jgi:class 3 adenylate cyclase/predicted ATPase
MTSLRDWLNELGLARYADTFEANDVDLDVVRLLTDADLERLGLSLGHRRRLLNAVAALAPASPVAEARQDAPPPCAADAPGTGATPPIPAAPGPERRQLTVMFCDLADSTGLSARLDPEDLQKVIGEYRRVCATEIERYEGYVAKYMGDGVLAYFGYPRARADAADRAVRAGQSIVEAIRAAAPGHELAVRVGIATGEVVVGEQIGIESSREWSVVGEAPNLAARLQTAAKPGQVLVADLTRRLARAAIDWSGPHLLSLKGFDGATPAWEAPAQSAAGGAAAASAQARPLVGRNSELALLADRLGLAAAGDSQVVLLIGEAGIGKSATARAIVERARADGVSCTVVQCSPFHQSSELNPFAAHIEREAGIVRGEASTGNLQRLRAWLGRDGDAPELDAVLLAALLSLPAPPDERLSDLTPQALRGKTLDALEAHILRADRAGPALFLFEDAHWLDPTSAELLNRCVNRIGRRRMMLLVTARPEFEARWTRQPQVTLLTLNRLGHRDAACLAAEALGAGDLPAEFIEQLLRRAEGNPLFIEELSKSIATALQAGGDALGDRQRLEQLLRVVPTTLRDLLAERLDRLGAAKETAQAAAAIGQEFDARLLAAIADRAEQSAQHLAQLVDAQIVVARGSAMPTTYSFRHALIQEAAYQSLLRSERRKHHRRIAESLERGVVPDLGEREPERIAQHYAEAGVVDRAIDWWYQSGIRAAQRSANVEAIGQLSEALKLVREQSAGAARNDTELSLLIALGPTLQATGGWGALKVREVFDDALRLARETGRAADVFPALWGRWLIAHASGEAENARQLLTQLADIADELGSPDLLLQLHHAAGSTHFTDGNFSRAIDEVGRCKATYDIELHRQQAMRYGGHDPCVCTTCVGALAQDITGRAGVASRWSDQALELAGRIAHAPSIAHAHFYRAELAQIRGEVTATLDSADRVLAIGIEKGLAHYVAWAKMARGWALTRQGLADQGVGEMDEGLAGLRRTGVRYHFPHRLGMRAQTYAAARRYAEAIDAADEALASVAATGERWYEAELLRIKARLLADATQDARPEVESLLLQAIDVAAAQDARLWECRARIELAAWLARQAREGAARDVLGPTQRWSAEFDIAERSAAAQLLRQLGG